MTILFYQKKDMIRIYRMRKSYRNHGGRYYYNITESSYKRLTDWMVKNSHRCVERNTPELTRFGPAFYYEFNIYPIAYSDFS